MEKFYVWNELNGDKYQTTHVMFLKGGIALIRTTVIIHGEVATSMVEINSQNFLMGSLYERVEKVWKDKEKWK